MDELIQQIVARTGIGEDKARMAVDLVLQHLKGRLPGPVSAQLDSAISGGGSGGGLGGVLGKLG